MKVLNVFWWLAYVCIAIFLQLFISGVDFFLPGIIVALQEKKITQFGVVFILFVLIQEGIGTMPFGNVFLWYSLAIIFFYSWRWFFEIESFTFILLLSAALAVSHYFIISVLAEIQDIYINYKSLQDESVYQMFLTPIMWHTANYLRRGFRYVPQD